VEDHPIIAELVETRLRIEGMEPIKCAGGREALDIIGTRPLDAVILDIMMPDVDGYEVLRYIRSQPGTRSLPVIFLTARSTPADIEKGLAMARTTTSPSRSAASTWCARCASASRSAAPPRAIRHAMTRLLAVLGLAAALVAAPGRADWSGVGGREVRLEGDGKILTVRATLNGSVEGLFLLDTGATYCVISQSIARRLGLRASGERTALVTANGAVSAPW